PIGLAALFGAVLCLRAGADLVSFGTSKDNTLYGDPGSAGSLSDGAGPHFYVGRAGFGSNPRRGIIAFDVMSFVPAGATINSATLSLNCSRSVISTFSPTTLTFNRVTQDWGEGASNSGDPGGGGAPPAPGDATWLHTFYPNAFWTNPGGDFASTASGAFGGVAAAGAYTLSAAGMTADVAAWLSNPS